jgi:hypothetical protein
MSVAVVGTPAAPAPFTSGTGASYTAGTGSNRVVVLVLEHSSSSGGGTPVYTGVQPTFGGVNMTQVGLLITSTAVRYMCCSMWRLKEASIPAGANTIVASWSDAANNLNEANALAAIYTLSGVNQTTPVTSTGSGVGNSVTTVASSSVTSTSNGLVIYGVSFNASTGTGVVLPTGYTTDEAVNSFDFSGFAAAGHKAITSGGTETPSVSWTGAGGAAILAANFQAVAAGGGNSNQPLLNLGVAAAPFAWIIRRRIQRANERRLLGVEK